MTKIVFAFACAFGLAFAASRLPQEKGSGKVRCITSATCPADKPVCVHGECEDPNDR